MKRFIFTLLVACSIFTFVSAQERNFWVGGDIGFEYYEQKEYMMIKFLPEFGYTLNDRFGIGIDLGYQLEEGKYNYGDSKLNTFIINPFVRYSFLKGNWGSLFVDGGIEYNYLKRKDTFISSYRQEDISRKKNALMAGFRPGVAVNLTDRLAFTAKIGRLVYMYEDYEDIDDYGDIVDKERNSFLFGVNLKNCLFGLNFRF